MDPWMKYLRPASVYVPGGGVLTLARVISLALTIGFIFAANATAKDAKDEGFSGKWVLDKRSPRPGDAPNNLDTRIKQDGSGFTIESTFKEPENGVVPLVYLGLMTTKVHLNTNGQEQENIIGPFTMTSKTSMNGNQMLTEWAANVKGDRVEGHWTHTLSDDGKRMTLEIKESSTQGQHSEVTLYFARK
jgi:hypothetical protein